MNTWVVVASAARARIFEPAGRNEPWREIEDLVNTEDRLTRQDFVSDKPGRAMGGVRAQRHTMDPTVDPKERAAIQFARALVARLDKALYEKAFDRLTLVAPPHFLGLLREQMGDTLRRAVHAEVSKDLTREDAASLPGHVAELL